MRKSLSGVVACAVLQLAAPAALALDGVAVSAGVANRSDDGEMARIALVWEWEKKWFSSGSWHLGGQWELSAGYWHPDNPLGGNNDGADIGITPVLRFEQINPGAVAPFIEAGVGAHLLSRERLHPGKDMGSNFQFGSRAGAGVKFGDRHRFELGYAYQHFSNAGFGDPNPGIDFHELRFGWRY